MKKIIQKIDVKTGVVTVTPVGFSGPECIEATKELEKRLGLGAERELTEDYHKQEQQHQSEG